MNGKLTEAAGAVTSPAGLRVASGGHVTGTEEAVVTEAASELRRQVSALYDDCGMAAFSLCLAIVQDEDIAAEIVIESCQSVPPASPMGRSAWLLSEAHRRAVMAVRGQPALRSDTAIEATQRLRTFATLTDEQRLAVGLTYFGGLSVGEVAARLTVSSQHILGLLSSALAQIQELNLDPSSQRNGRQRT